MNLNADMNSCQYPGLLVRKGAHQETESMFKVTTQTLDKGLEKTQEAVEGPGQEKTPGGCFTEG